MPQSCDRKKEIMQLQCDLHSQGTSVCRQWLRFPKLGCCMHLLILDSSFCISNMFISRASLFITVFRVFQVLKKSHKKKIMLHSANVSQLAQLVISHELLLISLTKSHSFLPALDKALLFPFAFALDKFLQLFFALRQAEGSTLSARGVSVLLIVQGFWPSIASRGESLHMWEDFPWWSG